MSTANNSNSRSTARRFAAGTLAIAVADSANSKIGRAATTYVEQRSCPTSCPLFDGGGCYAETGRVGAYITSPLNAAAAAVAADPDDIARAEAEAIDALDVVGGNPLRIHTVGDCKTDTAAATVAAAAERYSARAGATAWTYTHAWRDVERQSWGKVEVLASCEQAEDVERAHGRGYATAIVVTDFKSRRRYQENGVNVLPCPAQTTPGVTCRTCRLCFNSERLREKKLTIAFAVHGSANAKKRAVMALTDPDNPDRRLSSRVLIPRYIAEFSTEHGREPTVSEIAKALGMAKSSIYQMRKRLAAAGT